MLKGLREFVMRGNPYNRMRKPAEEAGPTELELLTEIRDELRGRRV